MTSDETDPELGDLQRDLDRTYGKARWYCFRGVHGVEAANGKLYAWLMPPSSPQVLLDGRAPAAVEARLMEYYRVLASPDLRLPRSAGSQARDAAEALDVTEYETGGTQ